MGIFADAGRKANDHVESLELTDVEKRYVKHEGRELYGAIRARTKLACQRWQEDFPPLVMTAVLAYCSTLVSEIDVKHPEQFSELKRLSR